MNDLSDIIKHFLKVYPETRSNDLLLIMMVCERKGFCKKLRTHYGSGFVFTEKCIKSGVMSRSLFETIRRTRQRLQQYNEGLRPSQEEYDNRQNSQKSFLQNLETLNI